MKTYKSHISKEVILETTLCLIDENGGIKNVTLRDIAKKLGCAHTNLYNYFNSLDEILWESLGQVLLKMIDYVDANLDTETDPEENFYLVLSNIIDFSMDHPGWYKLIWLESISGKPSDEVIKILRKPGEGFTCGLIKASSNQLSEEKANQIGDILHGYLHGELCKWINNRRFINSSQETKLKLLSNLKCLYRLLIK
jgi:AcrR family transcriptional regulator